MTHMISSPPLRQDLEISDGSGRRGSTSAEDNVSTAAEIEPPLRRVKSALFPVGHVSPRLPGA